MSRILIITASLRNNSGPSEASGRNEEQHEAYEFGEKLR